jgi:hypothetical protein
MLATASSSLEAASSNLLFRADANETDNLNQENESDEEEEEEDQTNPSPEPPVCKKLKQAETRGEELYLVHLQRYQQQPIDPTDYDVSDQGMVQRHLMPVTEVASPPRPAMATRRSSKGAAALTIPAPAESELPTIGEELWKIHCRRSSFDIRAEGGDDEDVEKDAPDAPPEPMEELAAIET